MLKKNLWLTYPCGYYGSYINWGFRKSDIESGSDVTENPLLNTGSSHGFLRFPTHQAMDSQIWWLYHSDKKHDLIIPIHNDGSPSRIAYGINSLEKIFSYIVRLDIDPYIINIHHNNNSFYKQICALNVVDKWMINLDIHHAYHKNDYNPWTDTDRKAARNYLKNNWETYFPTSQNLNKKSLMEVLYFIKTRLDIRHNGDPVEILYEQYPYAKSFPKDIYQITVEDILSDNFIDTLQSKINCSSLGNFNFDYWKKFHNEKFLPAQKNLNWQTIKDNFKQQGIINPYIENNLLAEALIFLELNADESLSLYELADTIKANL